MIPVSSFFEPSATVQSGATVEGSGEFPVTVRTPDQPWAYAMSFRRAGTLPDVNTLAVRIRIAVTQGTVGVGWLDGRRKQFIDEVFVAAGPEALIELAATAPFDLGPLMIRNWSGAEASSATVLGIECFALGAIPEAESDFARRPPLSEPETVSGWSRYYSTLGRGLRERVRVRHFESLTEPLTLTWSDGLSLQIVPGDQLSRAVYVSGTYEPNTLRVLRSLLQPGDVCLDVGANAGVVALAASRWVGPEGRVYAFEPSQREFARLCDGLERSRAANVIPIRAAVSSFRGRAPLRVAAAASGGLNTLGNGFAYDDVDLEQLEQVEVMTLDDFVEQNPVPTVAAIKLDIEGSEGEAIRGAARLLTRDRPALVLEVFARTLQNNAWTVARLEKLIADAGYVVFGIDDSTGELYSVASLPCDREQNVVALPAERSRKTLSRVGAPINGRLFGPA